MVKHNSKNFDLKTLCFESCQFKKEILHEKFGLGYWWSDDEMILSQHIW